MLPVIALVGRPNVGKSTLFNYLTRSRDALVADYPGLTRDRQYGRVKRGDRDCLVIDTGGLSDDAGGIDAVAIRQVGAAIDEADIVLFLVDAKDGLGSADEVIAKQLRKSAKKIVLVCNKIDGKNIDNVSADFHMLGLGVPQPITATHGRGVTQLLELVDSLLPPEEDGESEDDTKGIAIAIVGRPNVGKSTLVNRLLGEERVVVFDEPGTTRDSIYIPFERDGDDFVLIDTAGMRRRSRISETVEKFSIIKSMQAIDKANVVIYLIDASEGITDQDARLLGMVLEAGRSLVIGLNKWDGLKTEQREKVKLQLEIKLPFLEFAEKHFISALHGTGVGNLFDVIRGLHAASMVDMSTPKLTTILKEAIAQHQPPMVKNRRIKLKYAHQGGQNPPVIIIHGNQASEVPEAYKRYLVNWFRDKLELEGTPIRILFRSGANPFNERPRKLSKIDVKKREGIKRMVNNKKKRK
ncbi:MAG: ribosome biogenesis GTPase Der [Gammaproteobacteria bacterium]|nr:MAG: ribosome biogenesis GTPase Der [Gammaproteobacteria bacterium]